MVSEELQVYMPFDVLAWMNEAHPEVMGYVRFDGPAYLAGLKLTLIEPERFNGILDFEEDDQWGGQTVVSRGY
jgi:hypothetical protein